MVQTVAANVRQGLLDLTTARELEVTSHLNNITTCHMKHKLYKKNWGLKRGTEKEKDENAIKKEKKGKTITESKISSGKKELRNEY